MQADTHRLNNSTEVLVVDDDPESRAELSAAITETGLFCFAAEDAETALRKTLSRPSIGVVVTDVQMPGQDGITLIRRLREACAGGCVPEAIIITGFPALDVAQAAIRLSAVDFLSKPVGRSELLAAVTDASRRWSRRLAEARRDDIEVRLRELGSEISHLCAGLREAGAGFGPVSPPDDEPAIRAEAVKSIIRTRSKREKYFGVGFFSDPSWDMLLDLMAATLEGSRVTVSSLCNASRVPHATALRRLDELVDAGLAVRRNDTGDRRRIFVELTPRAYSRMTELLHEILVSPHAA